MADAAIKSARRVFEIMEFFDRERRPLGLKSICDRLGYPVSSGAAMLKSLVSLGYLEYDRKTQTYLPTMRIAVLGHWVSEQLFSEIRMLPLMEDLRDRTRETVIVGTQSDISAQYVHVLRSNQTISYSAEPGSLRPLARCGVGLTLLSNKSDADIDTLVYRNNHAESVRTRRVALKDVMGSVEKIRKQGFFFSRNLYSEGVGVIAMLLPRAPFTRTTAARALGVSPSAISKSVQRLEQRLGVKLFSRTTRSLVLTPEGRDLHERTLRLLREADAIEQAAVAARSEPAGVLRIAAPLPIGVHILSPAFPRFRERYPKLTIDLRLGDRFVDLIDEGIDVAIRVGDLADSRLLSRQLAPHRICAFASPDYLARRGVPAHPNELIHHDCVNFRFQSSGQIFRWPSSLGDRSVEVVPDAAIVTDVSDAVATVIASGGGVGITPTYVAAPFVRRNELVPVLQKFAVPRSNITALWPEGRRSNPNVKAFIAFLSEVFPRQPPWDEAVARASRSPG